jgi:phosphoglucomutase
MAIQRIPGKQAPRDTLIDVADLVRSYRERRPDPGSPSQLVSFGTSGHRGSAFDGTFNEDHILAIAQAIGERRKAEGIPGPLYMGKDSHALSDPAQRTALEVLAANGVETVIQKGGGDTPTPSISRAILAHNREHPDRPADGIVITPSHNPPQDGGIKYNPPHGGPADVDVTGWIQDRANALLRGGNREVRRIPYEKALRARTTREEDLVLPYVRDLPAVIDVAAIRSTKVKIGVDPLGGASLAYWKPVREMHGLDITVVNDAHDPTFAFMTLDHDGKIRMDCSSVHAMAGLIGMKDRYDVAFGCDPDSDRHGIVTPSAGLLNPNHYLAVAIHYLVTHRPDWPAEAAIGKTVVSSAIIDKVVAKLGRKLYEVPVGFKWFAGGLLEGTLCFGGEESAGASFLRMDGLAWSTDKDGLILGLLAAEIVAKTGKDPGAYYRDLAAEFGEHYYRRVDSSVTRDEKAAFKKLTPEAVTAAKLAGDPIVSKITKAPGNGQSIGGIKVSTRNGWFAARPSGTEDLYKLYAESFVSEEHLERIIREAQDIVSRALRGK